MTRISVKRVAVAAAALVACRGLALAQCTPGWSAYRGPSLDNGVYCLTTWNSPTGPVVVAGGNFEHAGSAALKFVGSYDGSAWHPMGQGLDGGVRSLATFDPDGSGPAAAQPVAGGYFLESGGQGGNCIARFDGTQWLPFGSGVHHNPGGFYYSIEALAAFQGDLLAGGQFPEIGGVPVQGLARWDGAAWHAFADEAAAGPNTFAVINGSLYAGGRFFVPGSTTVHAGVLRWDEPHWTNLGQTGIDHEVFALTLYHNQIVAAGDFIDIGNYIVAWNGTGWIPLGEGTDWTVRALAVFDPDGPGPTPELLFAGGEFFSAGGVPASGIAAWDGSAWSALGAGTSGAVRALTVWNNQLVVGGLFYSAGGLVSPGMAFWGCAQAAPCYANCDQSTEMPVLNVNDFVCFLTAFSAGSPYANCDGSTAAPVMNVNDFICFMGRFAQGCP